MAQPTKPTVPAPALRSDPDTFKERAESNILFWETFADYMDQTNEWVSEKSDQATAAALAGDLPDLSGSGGKLLQVKANESGLGFAVITTGKDDNTPNAITKVGDGGHLGIGPDCADCDDPLWGSTQRVAVSTENAPLGNSAGSLRSDAWTATTGTQYFLSFFPAPDKGNLYTRVVDSGVWTPWLRVYDTGNLAALEGLGDLTLAEGDLLYVNADGDIVNLGLGESGQVLTAKTPLVGDDKPEWQYQGGAPDAVLEEQTADGIAGTTITSSNTWITIELNTTVRNERSVLSLSSNEFTPSVNGWVEWSYPNRDNFQTRIYNVTDSVVVQQGMSVSSAAGGQNNSLGGAEVFSGKTYRLEVNKNNTASSAAANRGDGEVYTRLVFWRE
ncbi:pyocin knob domain-containing protein [Roseovarius sp. MMSF_3281]|uniref:pyocin knob domain-containing protein n=1 Tax=Roseovarius sp. MMSF_3281 TaxID=3046694 RepID=UPI00273F06A0|nr:pyocin knob domain-containing protein [Roseovarius sp. MMSF_3281]